jgi:mRNA interferase RelE/StbE
MYRIIVHKRAANYLRSLPAPEKERLKNALAALAADPFGAPDIKPMVGQWAGYHRMRQGNKRILFSVDRENRIVYVDHIGPRGDIYK